MIKCCNYLKDIILYHRREDNFLIQSPPPSVQLVSHYSNIEILEIKNKELKLKNKKIKLINNEIKLENKEIKLINNEIKLENNEIKLENNEIKLENNEIKLENKEIKLENKEIKLENKNLYNRINIVKFENKEFNTDNKILNNTINILENTIIINKIITALQDINSNDQLEKNLYNIKSALYKLKKDRNNHNHYISKCDSNDIINYKKKLLLKYLNDLSSNIKIRINKKYGNCNIIDEIIKYLNTIVDENNYHSNISENAIEEINDWWED